MKGEKKFSILTMTKENKSEASAIIVEATFVFKVARALCGLNIKLLDTSLLPINDAKFVA